jgi:hypothetical protein
MFVGENKGGWRVSLPVVSDFETPLQSWLSRLCCCCSDVFGRNRSACRDVGTAVGVAAFVGYRHVGVSDDWHVLEGGDGVSEWVATLLGVVAGTRSQQPSSRWCLQ